MSTMLTYTEQTVCRELAQNFGPPEAHITVAETSLLVRVSLGCLYDQTKELCLHPHFEQDGVLREAFEDENGLLRPSRFSGSLSSAIGDMCTRNAVDEPTLEAIISSAQGFIGPLLFRDPHSEGLPRLTHEVTVYSTLT